MTNSEIMHKHLENMCHVLNHGNYNQKTKARIYKEIQDITLWVSNDQFIQDQRLKEIKQFIYGV